MTEMKILLLCRRHPHIVKCREAYWEPKEKGLVMVMENCVYRSLSFQVELCNREKRTLPEVLVWMLLHDAVSGLLEAMSHSVNHRDIKLNNILVTPDAFLLADFGVSFFLEDANVAQKVDRNPGTHKYMSPEYWDSRKLTSVQQDIWALGVTLYEACTPDVRFEEAC